MRRNTIRNIIAVTIKKLQEGLYIYIYVSICNISLRVVVKKSLVIQFGESMYIFGYCTKMKKYKINLLIKRLDSINTNTSYIIMACIYLLKFFFNIYTIATIRTSLLLDAMKL